MIGKCWGGYYSFIKADSTISVYSILFTIYTREVFTGTFFRIAKVLLVFWAICEKYGGVGFDYELPTVGEDFKITKGDFQIYV